MLRRIIAVILGIVGGGMLVSLIQRSIIALYPLPEDQSTMQQADFIEFVQNLPKEAFLMILASHGVGALMASFIAAALSNTTKRQMGYIAGFVFLIFTIVTLASFPHPGWVYIADPLFVIAMSAQGVFLGAKLGPKT